MEASDWCGKFFISVFVTNGLIRRGLFLVCTVPQGLLLGSEGFSAGLEAG